MGKFEFSQENPMLLSRYSFPVRVALFVIVGFLFNISLLGQSSQAVANDDFYIVDVPQHINTYENDVNYAGSWDWFLVTAPSHGGAGPTCQMGLGCCRYCTYFNPGNYTGFDTFTYRHIPCCLAPPETPPSNIATVNVLLIGNDDAQNAGSCRSPMPSPNVGQPVNVANGNMWLEQRDYMLPGLGEIIEVNRFYNSIIQTSGLFGFGWSTKYDESLLIYPDNKMIRLNEPDGRASYFGRANTANPFTSFSQNVTGQIIKNGDSTYTFTYKDGRVHKFNSIGRLLWQKDRNGNQTTLNYNGSGVLTGITDAVGRTLTITINGFGNVSQISDALSAVASYEYFPSTNLLKTVTYNDGSKYKFEYDSTAVPDKTFLKTVRDALDNILETHLYDSSGRATTSEKQGGVEKYTLNYAFDQSNGPHTIVTDALGHVSKYYYTRQYGSNLITKTEGICSCGGGGSEVTKYFYDTSNSWLNLVKKTDALNRETVYTYDSSRNVTTMTDVLGIQSFTYNSLGDVLTATDRMGGVTTNTYNSVGSLLTSKDTLNYTTTLTYTLLGQLQTIKDALNQTTTLTYDSQGRLTQIKDANDKNTNFGYDARARLTSRTNALSQITSLEYDLNNRLKKVIYPDTNFVLLTYDLAGRRTAAVDPLSHTTAYAYDGAYRLTSVTDPLNHSTTYGYDLMSNLTSETDAIGNVTNREYDDFNRLKKIKYPAASVGATRLEENLTYDQLGNLKTKVDTAGRTTIYES